MPLRLIEPVEYTSNLDSYLNQINTPLNVNQNTTPVNLNQPRSHAETFLDLYKNSPTTRDYNINVNADLANRISGGLGSVPVIGGALSTMADVAMPAAAFIGSPFYDAIQGTYRGITDPDKSVWQAIKDENIGSTMWERMIGASAPLSERLSNWKDDFSIYGKAFAGDYIQNPKIQRFKQQQLMNRRKQNMQQRIRQAEAAEAAKQKAAADAKAAAEERRLVQSKKVIHDPGSGGGGGGGTWHRQTAAKEKAGQKVAGPGFGKGAYFRDGGLINFYRYGGFI